MIRPVACRLEADGLPTLSLVDGPIRVARLDLGDAVTREVVDVAPDADGTIDTTRFVGARSVALEATISPTVSDGLTRWELTQRLRAFTRADLRPRLYWQHEAGDPELMVTLRRSQFSDVLEPQHGRRAQVVVQWVAPSGLIESGEEHRLTGAPGSSEPQAEGFEFDLEFDLDFGGSTPSSNGVLVTNAGVMPVWPKVQMYGPMTNPTLLNDRTGEALVFDGLTISSSDWVLVDFAAKTIRNSTGTSYYDTLDFPSSTWWKLHPGENRIFVVPDSFTTPPAAFDVIWRDAWL